MSSDRTPRRRLLDAAVALLAERPGHAPTTRELCARAGVAAPSLYHHFGDKDGLLTAVLEEAFAAYLDRKHALPRSNDPVRDFSAGWDMHVQFGLDNPLLYPTLFASTHPRGRDVAARAAEELALELREMSEAGMLRVGVDDAVALTTAAATGCVLQLLRDGGDVGSPVSLLMREALLQRLCGTDEGSPNGGEAAGPDGRASAARALRGRLADVEAVLGREEAALLRAWLGRLADL